LGIAFRAVEAETRGFDHVGWRRDVLISGEFGKFVECDEWAEGQLGTKWSESGMQRVRAVG